MSGAPEPVGTLEVALDHAGAPARERSRRWPRSRPTRSCGPSPVTLSRRCSSASRNAAAAMPRARRDPRAAGPRPAGWAPRALRTRRDAGDLGRGDAAVAVAATRGRSSSRTSATPGGCSAITSRRWATATAPTPPTRNHIKASTRDPRLLAPAAALCDNRIPEAESLLQAAPEAVPDRRRGDPHARRGRRAARALRRRRDSCSPAAWSSRRASGRATQLRAGAAPAEQDRRGARARSTGCWPPSRATRAAAT